MQCGAWVSSLLEMGFGGVPQRCWGMVWEQRRSPREPDHGRADAPEWTPSLCTHGGTEEGELAKQDERVNGWEEN